MNQQQFICFIDKLMCKSTSLRLDEVHLGLGMVGECDVVVCSAHWPENTLVEMKFLIVSLFLAPRLES